MATANFTRVCLAHEASWAKRNLEHETGERRPGVMSAAQPAIFTQKRARFRLVPPLFVVLALGVLLFQPGLRSPLMLDDYIHAAMVDGTYGPPRGPFDLYDFVGAGEASQLVERGFLPWWSHPALKIRFFRPLASVLRWNDQRVFGRNPLVLHAHSLAWWVLAVLAARSLFKRVLPPRPLLLATAIFALAPCHVLPLAWLANREVLLSLTLGTLGLGAYARWREERRAKDGALAFLLFALAVLSGEYGLGFGGYVLAIEIVRRRESLVRRALGLAPFVVPVATYLAVRARLDYGTRGSGFYADPIAEPLEYARLAPWRWLVLEAQAWLSYAADPAAGTRESIVVAVLVLAGLVLVLVVWRRVRANLDVRTREATSWLLLGSVFALAPVLAVLPSPRVLGVSMLGVAVVSSLIIERAWWPPDALARRGMAELVALVGTGLAFAQLVHGPGTSFLLARRHHTESVAFTRQTAELAARLGDVPSTDVVVVRGYARMFFAPFALTPHGKGPKRWRILSQTGHVLLLRQGPRTFDVVVKADSSVFPIGDGNLFRSKSLLVRNGDVFHMPGATASVMDVGPSGPRRVRFEFDDDLGPWINEKNDDFADAELPLVGFGAPFDP
jgi:hypothetical protein